MLALIMGGLGVMLPVVWWDMMLLNHVQVMSVLELTTAHH